MAVIEGVTSAVAEVDPTFQALHTTQRPIQADGWFSFSAVSGAATAIAANAAVFSFRNISSKLVLVRRVGIGFIATTGFTAAQQLNWGMKVARNFTTNDTGGAVVVLTGNEAKLRTTHNTLTSVDCRISTTAALGAGAKTLDATNVGIMGAYAPAAGVGVLLTPSDRNLLAHDAGDHPLVLGQNEGFNIMNLTLMGAAGVGTIYVSVELAETAAY